MGGRRLLRPVALAGSAEVDSSLGGSFYTQGRGTFINNFGNRISNALDNSIHSRDPAMGNGSFASSKDAHSDPTSSEGN